MPENRTIVRLDAAPEGAALAIDSKWLGLEGDCDDVRNKYLLTVDDGDVTATYEYLRPIPRGRGSWRPNLSVQSLARGFWEMLESALLVDDRLLEQLGGLDIDKSNIPAMMAELKVKYDL